MTTETITIRLPDHMIMQIDKFQPTMTRSGACKELLRLGLEKAGFRVRDHAAGQDQHSGAAAYNWAQEKAPKIAEKLGFTHIGPKPTVAEYRDKDGKRLNLKLARRKTTMLGLYHTVRDRIDYVLAGFENAEDAFELYRVDVDTWGRWASPASPGSANVGRQSMLSRGKCREHGEYAGTVSL